jgi:site-specific DNA-cytosine methylase
LNNQKKSLGDHGESGSTFYGILNYAKVYRPPLVILENVKGAPWQQASEDWQSIGYAAMFMMVDTKDYYLPQTRERGYMICIDQERQGCRQLANDAITEWPHLFAQF